MGWLRRRGALASFCWSLCRCQDDLFHEESRDGKLEMSLRERYEYWQNTYADPRSADGKDWYGTWAQFKEDVAGGPFRASDRFLAVGCGSSSMPADLVADGFADVTGMDYSEKAIALQKRRFPEMKWVRADARSMPEFADSSFDVVIEKALMDGEGAWRQWPQMLSEYSRVLRHGGRFISISLGQPDELDSELFFANDSYGWDVRHAPSYDGYYVYTMTKRRKRSRRRRRRRPAAAPEL